MGAIYEKSWFGGRLFPDEDKQSPDPKNPQKGIVFYTGIGQLALFAGKIKVRDENDKTLYVLNRKSAIKFFGLEDVDSAAVDAKVQQLVLKKLRPKNAEEPALPSLTSSDKTEGKKPRNAVPQVTSITAPQPPKPGPTARVHLLVDDEKSMAQLPKHYPDLASHYSGPVKQGFETLDKHGFTMRRIAGGGHCLFRSIACLTMEFLSHATPEGRKAFFDELGQMVSSLSMPDQALQAKYTAFTTVFNEWQESNSPILNPLRNQAHSDTITAFLRHLAMAYNHQHVNEVYQFVAIDSSGSLEQYENDMIDMGENAIRGGDAEILALAKALGMNFQVLNVNAIGQKQKLTPEQLLFSSGTTRPVCYLLYWRYHYDVACAPRRANS